MRPRLIGVAGGSGSGKTTFARQLLERLGSERCAVLCQDSYYIDQSARFTGDGSVNFDHPDSLDFPLMARHLAALKAGQGVEVPIYDFPTHTRRPETQPFPARPVIVIDGILILTQPPIRAQLDASVFVETEEKLRFERRLARDVRERGRQPEGVRRQFELQVKPMHDRFVEPSRAHADRVISGCQPFAAAIEDLLSSLGI